MKRVEVGSPASRCTRTVPRAGVRCILAEHEDSCHHVAADAPLEDDARIVEAINRSGDLDETEIDNPAGDQHRRAWGFR